MMDRTLLGIAAAALLAGGCATGGGLIEEEEEGALLTQTAFVTQAREANFFDRYDVDDNAVLSETEFRQATAGLGIARSASFESFDDDENDLVNQNEFLTGVFNVLDEDDDNILEDDEYNETLFPFL